MSTPLSFNVAVTAGLQLSLKNKYIKYLQDQNISEIVDVGFPSIAVLCQDKMQPFPPACEGKHSQRCTGDLSLPEDLAPCRP